MNMLRKAASAIGSFFRSAFVYTSGLIKLLLTLLGKTFMRIFSPRNVVTTVAIAGGATVFGGLVSMLFGGTFMAFVMAFYLPNLLFCAAFDYGFNLAQIVDEHRTEASGARTNSACKTVKNAA